ncbi:MAG: helix-turn-helix domain-containing protein, partial [Bacteroidaceae bacterium]|nr:helix-turn-helix domain-containing protein [Bacteroidaceae bacterium]
MKAFGEKIKEARLAQNLNQEELAERIGSKYRSVSTWENGTAKPDYATLIRLCDVLKTSPNHLLGFDLSVDTPSIEEWAILHKYRDIDEIGKEAVSAVLDAEYRRVAKPKKARLLRLDFYNYPASAGTGNFLETERPDEILVKECSEAEDADYVIPISGDSMEPTYHDGDKVFVEKCDSVEIGEIGIFIVNGEAFIKELGNKCL